MGKEDLERVKEMNLGERKMTITGGGDHRPVLLRSNTMIITDQQASQSGSKVVCR